VCVASELARMPKERKWGRYAPNESPYFAGPFDSKETKYFDCQFDGSVSSTANWTNSVIPMAQYMAADGSTPTAYTGAALIPSAVGSGYGQVIGNKYRIKKLKIRGKFICPPNTPGSDKGRTAMLRWLVVLDTQANGAQAQADAFMTDWGSTAEMIDSFMSISSGSGGRFQILADQRFVFNPAGIAYDSTLNNFSNIFGGSLFEFEKRWKDGLEVVIKGGGTTPSVTALSGVNIFMVATSYNDTAGAQSLLVRGMSRCSYCE